MKEIPTIYPDDQVGFMLSQAYLLKQRVTNLALKDLDITYLQFVILSTIRILQEEKERITQQTIADKRRLDKVTVSNTVKTLVQKGLIKRNHHPEDHRALVLRLTTRGMDLAIKSKEIVKSTDKKFFSGVDSYQLHETLKRILTDNDDDI